MPDVSLPPVGELVQITYEHGQTELASWDGKDWHNAAAEWIGGGFIASWCRVLVLPDDETTRQTVRMKLWAAMVELGIEDAQALQHSVVLSHSAVAAVRGAAIR